MTETVLLKNNSKLSAPRFELFEKWVNLVLSHQNKKSQVSIEIVSSEQIQELNKNFRGKDKPTNILSFEMDLPDYIDEPLIGDLAICSEIIEKEASEQNKLIEHHWAHIIIHGVLHLLGYDHIESEDAKIMEPLEIELLAKLNISNPYAD